MNLIERSRILRFLDRESHALDRRLLVIGVVSALAETGVLVTINAAVAALRRGEPTATSFVLFILLLILFAYCLHYLLAGASRIAEAAVCAVRRRLADKIRRSDLLTLETIGEADLHARVSRETAVLTQAVPTLFAAARSLLVLLLMLTYVSLVSHMAARLGLALIAGGLLVYRYNRRRFEVGLEAVARSEEALFTGLTGLLRGFKEIRLNQAKSDDLFQDLAATASQVRDTQTSLMLHLSNHIATVQAFFMVMVAAIPFLLPRLEASAAGDVPSLVAASLFMIGPLTAAVISIPVLARTQVTLANLERLEASLDQHLGPAASPVEAPEFPGFQVLRLEAVGFDYPAGAGGHGFQVGPIDLELRRGELLFLSGANGSGKTTLLKLLTGLYPAASGSLRVDGVPVGPGNLQAYRHLFSAVFTDFHLFDKLHGLRAVAPERVDQLLERLDLIGKTSYREGRFSELCLSTGQRKRLALVVTFLEDKPVYLFDEVTADQDPGFRRFFFEVLLPELKQAGKTVLVVSHDDRFDRCADRLVKMDFGQLVAAPGESREPPVR
jgi:putative ATP-binding cassette transporter